MKLEIDIPGFRKSPKTPQSRLYRGRFTCPEVQWTGESGERFATFTITAGELADAADSQLIWTDQDVQRGIQPGLTPRPERELCLSAGYPNPSLYVFDQKNADDMAEKLLNGDRLFLSPLIWNLRPGTFEAFWNDKTKEIYLYSGKVYLPDSHHRHQAIIKAVKTWRDAAREYPRFSGDKEFKVELYFLPRDDEGNYFFDKNQRPKPTAKSKAFDLTTLDDLSLLAKKVVEKSSNLTENVNRVTDRLTNRNPQVITLSTLREMMKAFATSETLDASELEGLASVAASFYDLLAFIRPELGRLDIASRRHVRELLLVDAAVMMHGYVALMRDYNDSMARLGPAKATEDWRAKLGRLGRTRSYEFGPWTGDLFEKRNPLWREVGVVKPGKDPRNLTVINTGGARSECGRVLRQLVSVSDETTNLDFLAVQ